MRILLKILLGLTVISGVAKAQTDTLRYFESDFETLADRLQWTSLPADDIKKWVLDSKGGLYNPDYDLNFNPDTAFEGEYNALHYWSDFNPDTRKLVSIPIDLSDSKKPQLSFGHAMYQSVFGTDRLAVLFKAGSSAPWDTIAIFSSPVNQWTLRTFNIKDFGLKYLCKDFQVAFQSTARGGHGVCIDNVIIEEKDVIIRFVKSVKITGVVQNPLPSGASDIPVMRADIIIVGNTDPILLDSITFRSLSSHDSLFASNGFELVATRDSSFRPTSKGVSLKIGSPASVTGGKISFGNLNHNLPTGYTAIWLLADIKSTAPHHSIADFKVTARAIKIGNNKFPSAEVSPAGSNTIEQAVFYDSFEGTSSWTLQTDFETAVPKGFIAHITADPDFAYSGTRVLGTDLTTDGKYRLNINEGTAYYATTPAINLQYYSDVKLSFKKWIAFEGNDHGVIEVSTDNAVTWHKIWDSKVDALTPDNDWVSYFVTDAFNAVAAHQPWVKIRFGVVFSDNSFAYAGFNIDNFAVTGNYLTNDVGIVDLIWPVDDCFNPGMDSVAIVVKNYADRETASSIPVFFSIFGNETQKVYDTINGPIPKDGTLSFCFTRPANFPGPGDYSNFKVKLEAPGDEDLLNDAVVRDVFIQKSLNIPHLENFEVDGGYWKKTGSAPTWQCKTPEGSIPGISGSPNSWILSPYGNYLASDTSFIESSCYNLATATRSVFEMKLWIDSEPGKDGALIEYTRDDGVSWTVLPPNEFGWNWNWYNSTVTALGTSGWSGINTQNWKTVKQLLPASLSTEPKVRFRVKWASDEENTYRGMAVDEVRLYTAPPDIGVFQIDSFADRCQYINPDRLTVTIKNMGINPLKQNDTIIVGFDFMNEHMETDTFTLSAPLLPGQTMKHTFDEPVDVTVPGNYNLTAYTLIEDDPWFYLVNNDTVSLDFIVKPNPLTMLMDSIHTRQPDTVMIRPFYHADYDYLWQDNSTGSTYNVEEGGWYFVKVTATRGNGCSSHDSTYVELLFNDVGVDSLVFPVNHCGLGDQEYLTVRVSNFGTDSIQAGQKIAVAFSLNGGTAVIDTLILPATLLAGHSTLFNFEEGPVDLSAKGFYNFRIYADFSGDTIHVNDTIEKSIEIYGLPSVSLGPDITIQAISYTLDAGTGYTGYLWDNGMTERTRVITESGSYWVQVTDENQCENTDTTYIRLKIRDIRPDGFASPVSDCRFDPAEPVILKVLNSGTDTVPSGQRVKVSYRLNEGAVVLDSFDLISELLPGAYVSHAFLGDVSMDTEADYAFTATSVMQGDMKTFNDTANLVIYRYVKPEVDFGLEEIEYVNGIDITIDAGYDEHYGYLWQDGFDEHAYTATRSGTYQVVATDSRTSCSDSDTVTVYLIYSDVGVISTSLPLSGCTGTYDDVSVRIRNLGTSNIGKDVPIYLACDVNGTRAVIDTLIRSGNFVTGTNIDLVLSGPVSIGEGGTSTVAFYTLYTGDMKNWNDTLVAQFDALPSPEVDFGDVNGWLNVDLPYELNAGAGQQSYLWQDGSQGPTFMVTEKGTYSVTVTGDNDCQTTRFVNINMATVIEEPGEIRDVVIYPNPGNGLFTLSANTGLSGDLTVKIIDNRGRTVFVATYAASALNHETIDVQQLSRGIYYVLINNDKLLWRGKLIIQ